MTLSRARDTGDMTATTIHRLAEKLGYETSREFLCALKSGGEKGVAARNINEFARLGDRYRVLARDGMFDHALEVAQEALSEAISTGDVRRSADWCNRLASTSRDNGDFRRASLYCARTKAYLSTALKLFPEDVDIKLLSLVAPFIQIMVDDYRISGSFHKALSAYTSLDEQYENLRSKKGFEDQGPLIDTRQGHLRRQQANALRQLGRYHDSLALIRSVQSQYAETEYEAKSYASMAEADTLRKLGKGAESLAIYRDLKDRAKGRNWPGLLAAVLWREACSLQALGAEGNAEWDRTIGELDQVLSRYGQRYRLIAIYALLLKGSASSAGQAQANQALDDVQRLGILKPSYLALEYAHFLHLRGELFRARGRAKKARQQFTKSLECYARMGCNCGFVRSFIGLQLTGGNAELPREKSQTLEGLDRQLFEQLIAGVPFSPGSLAINAL